MDAVRSCVRRIWDSVDAVREERRADFKMLCGLLMAWSDGVDVAAALSDQLGQSEADVVHDAASMLYSLLPEEVSEDDFRELFSLLPIRPPQKITEEDWHKIDWKKGGF
jgi:hypothetical protein